MSDADYVTRLRASARDFLTISAIIFDALEIDPADTNVKLTIQPGGKRVATVNLQDAIRELDAILNEVTAGHDRTRLG